MAFAPVLGRGLEGDAWAVLGEFVDRPVVVTVDAGRLGLYWVSDGERLSYLNLGEARELRLTTRWRAHEFNAIEDGWTLEHPHFPQHVQIEYGSVGRDQALGEIFAPFLGA